MGQKGPERGSERRLSARVRVVGTAIVLTPERYVGTFLVENVSAEGALLAGDTLLSTGDQVRVLLQIHGAPRIGVRGKVKWRAERDGQHLFGLSFRPTAAAKAFLQNSAMRIVEKSSALTLVVEENAETCTVLTCELELMGCNALGVQTPLEAIGWLHSPGISVKTIAVGSSFADMDGLDLLEFIALDFPDIHRVLILPGNQAARRAPRSANAVLTNPWNQATLSQAFASEAP
jgi:CheY-like chemotaxis protein